MMYRIADECFVDANINASPKGSFVHPSENCTAVVWRLRDLRQKAVLTDFTSLEESFLGGVSRALS